MVATFIVSVAAGIVSGVISHFVCKWLDRR